MVKDVTKEANTKYFKYLKTSVSFLGNLKTTYEVVINTKNTNAKNRDWIEKNLLFIAERNTAEIKIPAENFTGIGSLNELK